MSPLLRKIGKKSVCFITVICLLLASAFTLSLVQNISAPVVFDNGNLNVTAGDSWVIKEWKEPDKPYRHNGNIYVTGASSLTILNSTVIFRPDSSINIMGGSSLKIENSVITVDINSVSPTYNLFFDIQSSNFEISNSTFIFPGTFNISSSNFSAVNSIFDQLAFPLNLGSARLIFNSSSIYYEDCQVNNFRRFDDVRIIGNSNMIAINTFIDLDYLQESTMYVDDSSEAIFYGLTINPGTYPYNSPIDVQSSSAWVNIYRWLYLNVTDILNTPIGNSEVTTKNTNLNQITPAPPQYILDYLNKNTTTYNITNSSGYVLLPLITDNLTLSSAPNSVFIGNYEITAYHNKYNTTMNAGLASYPILTESSNKPRLTLKFSDLLISPLNNAYFSKTGSDIKINSGTGTIRNSIYQKPQGGVKNMTFGQQGNIEVTGTGALELYSTGLGIEQDANNKYYIYIDDTGTLKLAETSAIMDGMVASGEYPINIYVNNTAKLTLEENSVLDNIGAVGVFSDSEVMFDSSEIHGDLFYAMGLNQNLIVTTQNNSFLNVTTLSITNAAVDMENTNISTTDDPIFSYVLMDAKNCTFNKPLTFSDASIVNLTNVTKPGFFNVTAKDTSMVYVRWYLTIVVKDSRGNRLEGAMVEIQNYTDKATLYPTPYAQGITDINGEFTYPVLGGIIDFDSGNVRRRYGGIIGNYNVSASFGSRSGGGSRQSGGFTDIFSQNQELVIIIPGAPDLEILDITTKPNPGVKNEETQVIAFIKNSGIFNASNIKVEFWDNTRNKQMGDPQTIDNLEPNEMKNVSITQYFLIEGDFNVRVEIDPDNLIGESNEKNNVKNETISIISKDKADLIFMSISTDPPSPISRDSEVTIGVHIRNRGNADADGFKVRFYINDTDSTEGEQQLGNDSDKSGLDFGDTIIVYSDTWNANRTGNFEVRVVVDIENEVVEHSEENNTITLPFEVVIGPDFTVVDIEFIPAGEITRDNDFTINAEIANVGPSNASNIEVGFYLDSLDSLISIETIGKLGSQESKKVELITKIPDAGTYKIIIEVDPSDKQSETNENNNTDWNTTVIVLKADLIVEDILFKYSSIENGEETDIQITVKNIGETKSAPFKVRVFDGKPEPGEEKQIPPDINVDDGLEPGESKTLGPVKWSTEEGGNHDIWARIMKKGVTLPEELTGNNELFKSIYVDTKADLKIRATDIITNKENEEILRDDIVEFTVTVHNGGDSTARNFSVYFWDGPIDDPENEPFAERPVIVLSGNNFINLSVQQPFFIDGNHPITVYVDATNVIKESNENNNIAKRTIFVNRTSPDLTISTKIDDILAYVQRSGQDVQLTDNIIVNGEEFWFKFDILNQGNDIVNEFTFQVEMDDVVIYNGSVGGLGHYYDLNPDSESISVNTTKTKAKFDKDATGYRKLTITLDPDNWIKESDEDNNIFEIDKGIKIIKLDIGITSIEFFKSGVKLSDEPGEVQEGDIIDMRVYVENRGSEPANTTLRIYKDNSLLSQISSENEITPNAEGVFIAYSGLVVDTSKDFTIRAELALADDTIKDREESMETNFMAKEIIFPLSDDGDDTTDNTTMIWMLFIIIIIVIIVVLVAVLLLRKRKREKMAECSECGALIPVDANTCPKCGAEFSDEIECGECGALMKVTDTTCPVCGAVFTKEGEAEGEEGEEEEEPGEVPKPGAPPAKKPTPPAPTRKTAPPKAAKPAAPAAAAKPGAPAAAPAIPAPPSTGAPAAKPAAGEEEEKAECYRCGAIVPLSASMCPECGAEFE